MEGIFDDLSSENFEVRKSGLSLGEAMGGDSVVRSIRPFCDDKNKLQNRGSSELVFERFLYITKQSRQCNR